MGNGGPDRLGSKGGNLERVGLWARSGDAGQNRKAESGMGQVSGEGSVRQGQELGGWSNDL